MMAIFFVRRDRFQDHVKRVLGFGSRSGSGSTSGSGSGRDRRGGGNAPGFFKFLHEIRGFHHGQFAQLIYDCGNVSHFTFQSRRGPQPRTYSAGSPRTDDLPFCFVVCFAPARPLPG